MNIKMKKRESRYFMVGALSFLLLFTLSGFAGETVVTVHQNDSYEYFKPEVKIAPGGDIYITYTVKNAGSNKSDIYISKYSTSGQMSLVKNLSQNNLKSYESEIDIQSNGNIHVAWGDQDGDTCYIRYRMYNGTWSGIQTLGQVNDIDNIEDLRIAVDNSGNVFIVLMHWEGLAAGCNFISKRGGNVSFENWPLSGRSKHADVDVDANYVHAVCQYRSGSGAYTIAYMRRPNNANGNWENWIDLGFYADEGGAQRPRMSLDSDNTPHVVFFHNLDPTRRLMYFRFNGSRFTDQRIMSDATKFETYHFCEVVALNGENLIATMQRGGHAGGKYVGYNWQKNGQWSGFSSFAKSHNYRPAKQSADHAPDKFLVALTFADRDDGVHLLIREDSGTPGGGGGPGGGEAPTANFTFSPQSGHAPLDVVFDGSGSSDSDGSVVAWTWNFGDGTVAASGSSVPHRFASAGQYVVTLTVTDNDGQTGSITHTVVVEPPNTPPTAGFTFNPLSGLYPLTVTFDASASTDSDGYIDQYDWDFGGEQNGAGQVTSYTFNLEGLYKISLTAYDDDGASSTATGTVEVLGLLPPQNLAAEAMTNRNLFTIQHVYKLTWTRNPGNAQRGANIVHYNIFRRRPNETFFANVGTVTASDANTYYDRLGATQEDFIYAIVAVDHQGRESSLPAANPTPVKPGDKYGVDKEL